MDAPLIEVCGLSKSFGPMPILRGVNLKIGAGASALIIGSNGAGKSTLLRILSGLSAPTIGSALLFGAPSHTLETSLRARVGLVTHQSFLYPNLTARENLVFYADLYGRPRDAGEISGWLERVGLAQAGNERVRTFSRGMLAERDNGCIRALILSPIDPATLYLAKLAASFIFMTVAEMAAVIMMVLFFNLTFDDRLLRLTPLIALGALGFAALATLLAAITGRVRAGDLLLPILIVPLFVPALIAGSKAALQRWPERNWLTSLNGSRYWLLSTSCFSLPAISCSST